MKSDPECSHMSQYQKKYFDTLRVRVKMSLPRFFYHPSPWWHASGLTILLYWNGIDSTVHGAVDVQFGKSSHLTPTGAESSRFGEYRPTMTPMTDLVGEAHLAAPLIGTSTAKILEVKPFGPMSSTAKIPGAGTLILADHHPKRKRDADCALDDIESCQQAGGTHTQDGDNVEEASVPPPRKRLKVRHAAASNSRVGGCRQRRAVACAVATVARNCGNVVLWSQDPPSLQFNFPRFRGGSDDSRGALPSFYRSVRGHERNRFETAELYRGILSSTDLVLHDSIEHTSSVSFFLPPSAHLTPSDLASHDAPNTVNDETWMLPVRCTLAPSTCHWNEGSGSTRHDPLLASSFTLETESQDNSSHHDYATDLPPQNVASKGNQDRHFSLKEDAVSPLCDSFVLDAAMSHWTIRTSFLPADVLAPRTDQAGAHRSVGFERGFSYDTPFGQGYQHNTEVSSNTGVALYRVAKNLTVSYAGRSSEVLERPPPLSSANPSDTNLDMPRTYWTNKKWKNDLFDVVSDRVPRSSPFVASDLHRRTRPVGGNMTCAPRDRIKFQHEDWWISKPNISLLIGAFDLATDSVPVGRASSFATRNGTFPAHNNRTSGLKRKIEMAGSKAMSDDVDSKRRLGMDWSHRPAFFPASRWERSPLAARDELDSRQASSDIGSMQIQRRAVSKLGPEMREVVAASKIPNDEEYHCWHATPFRSMIASSKLVLVFTARLALDHVTTVSRLLGALKRDVAETNLVPRAMTHWILPGRVPSGQTTPLDRKQKRSRDRRAIAKH
jgi:hypothetical protein